MKKILMILIAAMVVFGFTACNNSTPAPLSYENNFAAKTDIDCFTDGYYLDSADGYSNTAVSWDETNGKLKVANDAQYWANFWTNMPKSAVKLEAGKTYEISYKIDQTALAGSTLTVGFNLSTADWTNLYAYNWTPATDATEVRFTVKIADDWSEATVNNGSAVTGQKVGTATDFDYGTIVIGVKNGSTGSVLIDDFMIEEI